MHVNWPQRPPQSKCQVIRHRLTITLCLIVHKLLRTSGWNEKSFFPRVFLDERMVWGKLHWFQCLPQNQIQIAAQGTWNVIEVTKAVRPDACCSSGENRNFRAPLCHQSASLVELTHLVLIISYRVSVYFNMEICSIIGNCVQFKPIITKTIIALFAD